MPGEIPGGMAGEWIPVDAMSFVVLVSAAFASLLLATALRPVWVIRRARFVLAAILAISLAAVSVLVRSDPPGLRLEIDPSTEPLLPTGDPGQELYRSAVNDFGDDEVYVIAVECEEVFTTACLGAMEAISTPIARLPGVRSVKSLLDVTSFRYVAEEDWIEVRPFIEDIPTDVAELASLRARAIQDPMYRRTMVSDDSRTAALNITFRSMSDAELIAADLDGRIASIIAENSRPGVSFYVSGRPHFKTIVYHGVSRDLLLLIPLSVLVIAAVLWLVTGTKRAVVLPLGVSLTAILWTFSAMVLLGRPVTLLSGMLGPMLLAIGSVYAIPCVRTSRRSIVCSRERFHSTSCWKEAARERSGSPICSA